MITLYSYQEWRDSVIFFDHFLRALFGLRLFVIKSVVARIASHIAMLIPQALKTEAFAAFG